jgi:hypothetical protein
MAAHNYWGIVLPCRGSDPSTIRHPLSPTLENIFEKTKNENKQTHSTLLICSIQVVYYLKRYKSNSNLQQDRPRRS